MIVSTHATFLEEDYMNNFKPKSKVVLEELDSVRDPPQTPIFPPLFHVDSVSVSLSRCFHRPRG